MLTSAIKDGTREGSQRFPSCRRLSKMTTKKGWPEQLQVSSGLPLDLQKAAKVPWIERTSVSVNSDEADFKVEWATIRWGTESVAARWSRELRRCPK